MLAVSTKQSLPAPSLLCVHPSTWNECARQDKALLDEKKKTCRNLWLYIYIYSVIIPSHPASALQIESAMALQYDSSIHSTRSLARYWFERYYTPYLAPSIPESPDGAALIVSCRSTGPCIYARRLLDCEFWGEDRTAQDRTSMGQGQRRLALRRHKVWESGALVKHAVAGFWCGELFTMCLEAWRERGGSGEGEVVR